MSMPTAMVMATGNSDFIIMIEAPRVVPLMQKIFVT